MQSLDDCIYIQHLKTLQALFAFHPKPVKHASPPDIRTPDLLLPIQGLNGLTNGLESPHKTIRIAPAMHEGEIVDTRFRVVFKGELLNNVAPEVARHLAAERFNANPEQIERIFSGRPVTLKGGLDAKMAARYGAELRRIGLRVLLEPEASPASANSSAEPGDCSYRIVFAGQTLDGFEREAVIQAAIKRLHASPMQVSQLFSGQKSVLKKGLDEQTAHAYAKRLRQIGMHVAINRENVKARATNAIQVTASPRPEPEVAPPARHISNLAATQIYRPSAELVAMASTVVHKPVLTMQQDEVSASHVETLVHTPLQAASAMLDAATTQVDFDFTQTMMDQELASTQPHERPDLEGTMVSTPVALLAQFPDNEALAKIIQPKQETVFPPPPPAYPVPVRPAPVRPETGASESGKEDFRPRVVQVCAGCGARQSYGRFCSHCGYEFPTAPKILIEPEAQPSAQTRPQAMTAAADAIEDISAPAISPIENARRNRLLLVAATLVILCGAGWFLLRLGGK